MRLSHVGGEVVAEDTWSSWCNDPFGMNSTTMSLFSAWPRKVKTCGL